MRSHCASGIYIYMYIHVHVHVLYMYTIYMYMYVYMPYLLGGQLHAALLAMDIHTPLHMCVYIHHLLVLVKLLISLLFSNSSYHVLSCITYTVCPTSQCTEYAQYRMQDMMPRHSIIKESCILICR